MNGKRRIAILGSTGSIGTQTLDVIRQHPDLFEVELISARSSVGLLVEQAKEFDAASVVICDESRYETVRGALQDTDCKVWAGIDSLCELVQSSRVDIVVGAMVGFSGLRPTLAALEAGKIVALANKETLVAAGSLIMPLATEHQAPILPVDSEHSAIFQCLQGERTRPQSIILTCSGGPFLHTGAEDLEKMTAEEALKHPRWKMGQKVTIDSSTLMNKGFEMIEASWLFDMKPQDIEVIIHPESIIHSMVRFPDGCVMAQLSNPDMRLPIQYALSYPCRTTLSTTRLDFALTGKLTFLEPDTGRFPCLEIARKAIARGGNACCAMNAANESAVAAFLQGRIGYTDIPRIVEEIISRTAFIEKPDLDAIFSTNFEARRAADELIDKKYSR